LTGLPDKNQHPSFGCPEFRQISVKPNPLPLCGLNLTNALDAISTNQNILTTYLYHPIPGWVSGKGNSKLE
jgi:hypothetical protein